MLKRKTKISVHVSPWVDSYILLQPLLSYYFTIVFYLQLQNRVLHSCQALTWQKVNLENSFHHSSGFTWLIPFSPDLSFHITSFQKKWKEGFYGPLPAPSSPISPKFPLLQSLNDLCQNWNSVCLLPTLTVKHCDNRDGILFGPSLHPWHRV